MFDTAKSMNYLGLNYPESTVLGLCSSLDAFLLLRTIVVSAEIFGSFCS